MTNAPRLAQVGPEFSPQSIARAIWKRKLFILGFAVLGTGATVAVVSRLVPTYKANAVILVESQKIPENFVAATVQTALEAQLDTLKQQVLSRDRLWGLMEEYALFKQERQKLTKEEVYQLMRRQINITFVRGWSARGPGAFQVEYEAENPETAAAVTNRIGNFFINENLRQRTEEASETSKFLAGQLAEAENRLRQQESKLREFKLVHNGELPEQQAALLAAVAQSRAELLGIQDSLARAQQNKLILENSLAYAEDNLRRHQDQLRRQASTRTSPARETVPPAPPTPLEQAESELSRLRARYHDLHPEVQRMTAEVHRLRQEERAQGTVALSPPPVSGEAEQEGGTVRSETALPSLDEEPERNRIQELRAQISLVKGEIRGLEQRRLRILGEVEDTQARIRNLPVREQQLSEITRDYETSKNNYQSLLNKKLAADVAMDMERWHKSQKFVMLDPARVPQKPTRPRRALLISAGALLSMALGTVLGFLLELRKGVVLGEWELPAGVVVLGRIPRMKLKLRSA